MIKPILVGPAGKILEIAKAAGLKLGDAEIVDAVLAKINELNTRQPVVVEDGKVVDPLPSTNEQSKSGKTDSVPSQTP